MHEKHPAGTRFQELKSGCTVDINKTVLFSQIYDIDTVNPFRICNVSKSAASEKIKIGIFKGGQSKDEREVLQNKIKTAKIKMINPRDCSQ